jgi:hypothetical protein
MSQPAVIPLGEVVHFDVRTHNPETGSISDADSTPTFNVFEEATDTAILATQNFTKRTSLTGKYRGTFTASLANGFEIGKWYNVDADATVNSISASFVVMTFMIDYPVGLTGTAQGPGTGLNTLQLQSGQVPVDDFFNGMYIAIVDGTGGGQPPRQITDSDASDNEVFVLGNWNTAPDNTSVYVLFRPA